MAAAQAEGLVLERSTNLAGYLGVWRYGAGGFAASLGSGSGNQYLGHFSTAEEAALHYARAKKRMQTGAGGSGDAEEAATERPQHAEAEQSARHCPVGEEAVGMAAVRALLDSAGVGQYAEAFDDQGYDDLGWLLTLSPSTLEQEVAAACGMEPEHAVAFVARCLACRTASNSSGGSGAGPSNSV